MQACLVSESHVVQSVWVLPFYSLVAMKIHKMHNNHDMRLSNAFRSNSTADFVSSPDKMVAMETEGKVGR